MTTIDTNLSTINLHQFLDEIYEIDPLAAVRIANKWGNPSEVGDERYEAAWNIVSRQTVVPNCPRCYWPVLDDDLHTKCDAELSEMDNMGDDSDFWSEARCGGDQPGLMVDDVPDDFIEHDEVDDSYDDQGDGCPHCGSHACNTWDCQQ